MNKLRLTVAYYILIITIMIYLTAANNPMAI